MMDARIILAIETSQRTGSVAVSQQTGAVDHEPLRDTLRHEDDLMPAIDRMCRRSGISPRDLAAVAVSIGPGGFTGLRIAVSTAKMLAESLGSALVPVPSALVAAESIDAPGPIIVCLASKRDTTWASLLERQDSHWHFAGGSPAAAGIRTADNLDLADIKLVVADEYLPEALRERIERAGCAIIAPRFDARQCLAIAKRLFHAGDTTDSLSLMPIYARPPEAVRLWEAKKDARIEKRRDMEME